MYENFKLTCGKYILDSHRWDCESPRATICFIHGIGEHATRYSRIYEELNNFGISILAADLPGHGKSTGIQGHIGSLDLIMEIIDSLVSKAKGDCPEAPVFVYGHSMGGCLSLYHRLKNYNPDVLAYIITSPWLILKRKFPKPLLWSIDLMSMILPEFSISSSINPADITDDSSLIELYSKDPLNHSRISFSTLSSCQHAAQKVLEGANLELKPIFLAHGDNDNICSVEGSRRFSEKAGSQCVYREFESNSHELHNASSLKKLSAEILLFVDSAVALKKTKNI